MKTSHIIIGLVAILLFGGLIFTSIQKSNQIKDLGTTNGSSSEQPEALIGCYVARINKDLYTLHIQSITNENFTGHLEFDNFEKDSSSGSYSGTYKNGILLGDYSFRSEGIDSVMQVIFKKSGNDFIRGYGQMSNSGTKFTNWDAITYDANSPLSVFKKEACVVAGSAAQTQITYPAGGEKFTAGKTYTLTWQGGPDPIYIFLIDTALKSEGASVSIVDRVYGIKNTGAYSYTVPKNLKAGNYEFTIGDSTSRPLTVSLVK